MADESEFTSRHKFSSKPTLFPIQMSESQSVMASHGLLFPCASVKVQGEDGDKGNSNATSVRSGYMYRT